MKFFFLLLTPLLCVACATSSPKMDHYLLQDTRASFEAGMQKNYAKCAPVAFAEAEAHLVMANHELSEGNMDRSDALALKQKADVFLAQAKESCTPKVVKPIPVLKVAKVIKKVKIKIKKESVKKQQALREAVYFKSNQFKLSEMAQQKIESIVLKLLDKQHANVIVSGHADEQGSAEVNQRLSCLRTNEVGFFLVKSGLNIKNVKNHCHGESKPSSQGHDEKAWKKNRRVDIHILPMLNAPEVK
ncbi:MAG: OmpA family protein [Mariprofundaceae bacterium]|nr:OmpA family protein [Mariprofundaceae bacterium]